MGHGSTGMHISQKPLSWSMITALLLPKLSPQIVGGDKVPPLYTGKWLGKSVWISPPMEKANPFVGLSLPKDLVYLVGNVEGWGDPVCSSRRFNLAGKAICVSFLL